VRLIEGSLRRRIAHLVFDRSRHGSFGAPRSSRVCLRSRILATKL
jgi:hypothetical protein